MTKFRNFALLSAGICIGAASAVGFNACAESRPSQQGLPLSEVRQFASVFNAIKDFYVDDVSDAKLLKSAVEGMVSGLDPHSDFLDEKGFKEMTETTQGSFGGLGIEITKDPAGVRVMSPIDDTPAARAGIRAGDIITRIDNKSIADMSLTAAVKLMRGEPNTKIDLTIARKGVTAPLNITLTRAIIKTQSVKMKELDNGLGYIRIAQFQERTTEDLVHSLNKLAASGHLKGLVLDLRNDPGGLLQAAVGVSAAFLPAHSTVVSTKGRIQDSNRVFTATEADYRSGQAVKALSELTPIAKNVPLVVLINSASASASEIVAGALQDHKRAVLMGDRSFGKGSVQTILPMRTGDKQVALKFTTARYFTPSGRSIQARGIIPDLYVDDTPKGNYPSFQIRESDLTHHLLNQDESVSEEEALKDLPFDGDETVMPDYQYRFGDTNDWQLMQAVNYLQKKTVTLSPYRGKPRDVVAKLKAEEEAKKTAEEAGKAEKPAANSENKAPVEMPKP